jgi:cation diffusion facilitator family transporter
MKPSLKRYAAMSVAAAIATIALKGGAYLVTGSVAILSDAAESLVNLAAALIALYAISVAERPEDEEHAYGHTKAEYFSSGFEGALILIAASTIGYMVVGRLLDPRAVEEVGLGLTVTAAASVINFAVARVLRSAGRRYGSISLEADARHLMADVWTSAAVLVGVGLTALSGWEVLDPLIAIGVAVNIVRIGLDLVKRSMLGLLDTSLPTPARARIVEILDAHREDGILYHALRTRQAGTRTFVSFHILVPGEWSVQRGHDLLETIEDEIRAALPNSTVFTHLEPIEDPVSFQDTRLERPLPP